MTDFDAGIFVGIFITLIIQNMASGIGSGLGKAILWITKKVGTNPKKVGRG